MPAIWLIVRQVPDRDIVVPDFLSRPELLRGVLGRSRDQGFR
jgi:hypothetical protein